MSMIRNLKMKLTYLSRHPYSPQSDDILYIVGTQKENSLIGLSIQHSTDLFGQFMGAHKYVCIGVG